MKAIPTHLYWTRGENNVWAIPILNQEPNPDYRFIASFSGQNQLRHALAILDRTPMSVCVSLWPVADDDWGSSSLLGRIIDWLSIRKDGKHYILQSSRISKPMALFLAGILTGRRHVYLAKRRRRRNYLKRIRDRERS